MAAFGQAGFGLRRRNRLVDYLAMARRARLVANIAVAAFAHKGGVSTLRAGRRSYMLRAVAVLMLLDRFILRLIAAGSRNFLLRDKNCAAYRAMAAFGQARLSLRRRNRLIDCLAMAGSTRLSADIAVAAFAHKGRVSTLRTGRHSYNLDVVAVFMPLSKYVDRQYIQYHHRHKHKAEEPLQLPFHAIPLSRKSC